MSQDVRAAGNALMVRTPASATGRHAAAPAELERVRREVDQARADAVAARARMLKSTRDSKVRLRVTAVIMMTAALLRLAWEANSQLPAPTAKVIEPIRQSAPPAALRVSANSQPTAAEVALDRLRDAFHLFPDEDQPVVVSEVNARYAGTDFTCPLAWSINGMPALLVKDRGPAIPMMAGALNQCAAGVEKLREERDAAAAKSLSNKANSGRD